MRSDLRVWKLDFQFLYETSIFSEDKKEMNRPGKDRKFGVRLPDRRGLGQGEGSIMARTRQVLPRVEEGLVRVLFPLLAGAAVLVFFTIVYRLVDDPLVAGVIALIVPMIFLPLFRGHRVN